MTRLEILRFMCACEELITFVELKGDLTEAERKSLRVYSEKLMTLSSREASIAKEAA